MCQDKGVNLSIQIFRFLVTVFYCGERNHIHIHTYTYVCVRVFVYSCFEWVCVCLCECAYVRVHIYNSRTESERQRGMEKILPWSHLHPNQGTFSKMLRKYILLWAQVSLLGSRLDSTRYRTHAYVFVNDIRNSGEPRGFRSEKCSTNFEKVDASYKGKSKEMPKRKLSLRTCWQL